jgi:hypothetical protein
MSESKKFMARFAMFTKNEVVAKKESITELTNQLYLLKNSYTKINVQRLDSSYLKLVAICIEILEYCVPILGKKEVSRVSFRLNSSSLLCNLDTIIQSLNIDLEDKIVVKMSSICVDFVFKTSVLREFVFTNYCLNLPELSHLIKYNKEDLISS